MRVSEYKMYSYTVIYTVRVHVRDEFGETTGQMKEKEVRTRPMIVAKSRALADAWIRERYNASYQDHKDFAFRLISEQAAPHMLMESTG